MQENVDSSMYKNQYNAETILTTNIKAKIFPKCSKTLPKYEIPQWRLPRYKSVGKKKFKRLQS